MKTSSIIKVTIIATLTALITITIFIFAVPAGCQLYIKHKFSSGRIKAAKMQIPRFSLSLETYQESHGTYPSTTQGLQALVNANILKDRDILDPWGNTFNYRFPGKADPAVFDIWSYGANGVEGGTGEDADINSWDELRLD